jgi:hypothetical protein
MAERRNCDDRATSPREPFGPVTLEAIAVQVSSTFPCSSMAEQRPVKATVESSNLSEGARVHVLW